jgi:hypothetical protein
MRADRLAWLVVVIGLLVAPAVRAQVPAKPGPEHERLKKLEGTWDATVKFGDNESKGTMTWKMDLGGLWLLGHFKGEFGGQEFQGRGVDGYDPIKKKYVGIWIDSMSPTPMISEGNYDEVGKVVTMHSEGRGEDGKPTKIKSVTEIKDADNLVLTMSSVDKDGKDQTMMTITYKRKKAE